MRLTISGVHDFPDLSGVDAVISLQDPHDGRPAYLQDAGVPVLDLVFHDTDGDDLDQIPEVWHLRAVERFLDSVQPMALHVHCFAGMSRSPALAAFALATVNPAWSDMEVLQAVIDVRPQSTPNPHLLRLADDALGRQLATTWKARFERY